MCHWYITWYNDSVYRWDHCVLLIRRFHQTKYTMHTWHNVWICPQMRSMSLSWSVFGTNFPSDSKHDTRNNVWFCQQMNSLCLSWYRCLGTEVRSDWPHTRLMPGTSCSRFLPDPCTIPPRSEKSLYADSLTSR